MPSLEDELRAATERILTSQSHRRLIVAGPGAGKTYIFRKLLEQSDGNRDSHLVLTFITNLKDDLDRELSSLARVHTLHGYCIALLKRHASLRGSLSSDFVVYPALPTLIKKDWSYVHGTQPPRFIQMMRDLTRSRELRFYFERTIYYDAVSFDDSIFRLYETWRKHPERMKRLDLVLIDEFQDFHLLEAELIDLMAENSPVVIAGDDDQALYGQLRGASWDHIRALHGRDDYEVFELPFCLRCPEVIVEAVNDLVRSSHEQGNLTGRIDKPYRHYPPIKGADSSRFPRIDLVTCTVQSNQANYFGRYVAQELRRIPAEDIQSAIEKHEPAALVIGPRHYLNQIERELSPVGWNVDRKSKSDVRVRREDGLRLLRDNQASNLGWRIVLDSEQDDLVAPLVRESVNTSAGLFELIPEARRRAALDETASLTDDQDETDGEAGTGKESSVGTVKLVSFEGAKGLSAQYVFLAGLHNGDLPRNPEEISDIEICKLLVGLTRARRKCAVLCASRFSGQQKELSTLLSWIDSSRFHNVSISAAYWRRQARSGV